MIIHASLRTDIVDYYLEWFLNRMDAGFVDVKGKNNDEIIRYNLSKKDEVKFYTKNPIKMLDSIRDVLSSVKHFEVITKVVLYDKFYHPQVIPINKTLNAVNELGRLIKKRNAICYGPVFTTSVNDVKWHVQQFENILQKVHKNISKVYVSFEHKEGQCGKGLNAIRLTPAETAHIYTEFCRVSQVYGLECAILPSFDGLKEGEIDIGQENACLTGCRYCKHNENEKAAKSSYSVHDANSSLLIGRLPYEANIVTKSRGSVKNLIEMSIDHLLF